jgi:asparagine synthase (glutamine-hydrolysing)
MCGFSGVLFADETVRDGYSPGIAGFRRAAARVAHRGDSDHRERLLPRLWLNHYRLAFQDVAAGVQPMPSADGRHVIVFNGEVYNHLALRPAIVARSGVGFRTRSDTETLIEGWKAFGAGFFERLEGEYAFVIAATNGSELVAHRDRYGVKPLFLHADGVDSALFATCRESYAYRCGTLEFSSEVKGLASERSWNRDGLLRQFVGLFEPIRTPFDRVIQLPPGGRLEVARDPAGLACRLWTFTEPVRVRPDAATDDAETAFVDRMRLSVQERLLSDVELGVYLSGGVDSKVVAYELARLAPPGQTMKAFTIGFSQAGYDETAEALRFAAHAGFDPHVLRIDDVALNYAYPLAVQNSELVQPFTNGAAKWWLSLFTRQYVHGVLTGDGADELLCGYPSYRYANWWKFIVRGRGEARTMADLERLLATHPLGSRRRDSLYRSRFASHAANPWLAGSSAAGSGQDFVDSLAMLGVPHPLFGQVRAIAAAVLGRQAADEWIGQQAQSVQSWFYAGLEHLAGEREDPRHSLLLWQNYFARTHLPTLILNWVGDRMEMANTLEGRTPFLSDRLRRFVQGLPDRLMVSGLRDKILMRRAYRDLLGGDFAATPKKQFNAPFLDSDRLAVEFAVDDIFAETGLNPALKAASLTDAADRAAPADPYQATHLRAAYQTALAAGIVNHSIVQRRELPRDPALERRYLERGGPMATPPA